MPSILTNYEYLPDGYGWQAGDILQLKMCLSQR